MHCAHLGHDFRWYLLCLPKKDSQAELTWVAGYIPRWSACPNTVTNWAWLGITNTLPLSPSAARSPSSTEPAVLKNSHPLSSTATNSHNFPDSSPWCVNGLLQFVNGWRHLSVCCLLYHTQWPLYHLHSMITTVLRRYLQQKEISHWRCKLTMVGPDPEARCCQRGNMDQCR